MKTHFLAVSVAALLAISAVSGTAPEAQGASQRYVKVPIPNPIGKTPEQVVREWGRPIRDVGIGANFTQTFVYTARNGGAEVRFQPYGPNWAYIGTGLNATFWDLPPQKSTVRHVLPADLLEGRNREQVFYKTTGVSAPADPNEFVLVIRLQEWSIRGLHYQGWGVVTASGQLSRWRDARVNEIRYRVDITSKTSYESLRDFAHRISQYSPHAGNVMFFTGDEPLFRPMNPVKKPAAKVKTTPVNRARR